MIVRFDPLYNAIEINTIHPNYKDVINSPEDKRLYLHLKTPSIREGIKNGMALVRDQIKNSRHTINYLSTEIY